MTYNVADIKKVSCPRCNAAPGAVCKNYRQGRKGTPVRPHAERMRVYERSLTPTPDDATITQIWGKVTEPREALRLLVDNWHFIGTDPYYRDLNNALLEMAERCLK